MLRTGVIGLGGRGRFHAEMLANMSLDASFPCELEISALCDVYPDRAEAAAAAVQKKTGTAPAVYTNENDFLNHENLQAIIVATSWQTHIPIAVKAIKKGIRPAIECGGASNLDECFGLVFAYEETGVPCMFLENCNYGREEMALLNMTQKGVFGELIHLQCGYQHDLRTIATSWEGRHYRLDHHIHRNGDFYPMHGLGPMMKLLKIHNGNRFVSLVSVSSKARGIKEWAKEHLPADHHIQNKTINQGDIITSVLKTSNGETLVLTHDTSLPRPYSRAGRVQGTKGIWMEDNASIYIEGVSPGHTWENFYDFIEKHGYEHPMWDQYQKSGIHKEGHGGMDYLVVREFLMSAASAHEPPVDTYEAALLASITPLSEKSISLGSHPVEIPDFTHGLYMTR
ncbi:MAG: Gfo/Idh/MocA family oxidoreductase [Oscillospiraceae bacterium]|nr:Gfo/Idh/MocA family oxidoreductase [Oscillospiraceae bacterium]